MQLNFRAEEGPGAKGEWLITLSTLDTADGFGPTCVDRFVEDTDILGDRSPGRRRIEYPNRNRRTQPIADTSQTMIYFESPCVSMRFRLRG